MPKMWTGRTSGETDKTADIFNSSIAVDSRMFKEDIAGSIAHAKMLSKQGIITAQEGDTIVSSLQEISDGIESGEIPIDPEAEDIHMFVEQVLTEKTGSTGKKLHTARSRNDQVALDTRLYLMGGIKEIIQKISQLICALKDTAEANIDVIMPGYTHMQHAQPVLFSHYMLSYAMMLIRDTGRLQDAMARMNVSPIGACALAGTTYNTDREYEAELLGFDGICLNSLDAVSDRDFCLEFMSDAAILMMHLSRLSEELIIWSTSEFSFVEFSDEYTTGSSIMPQKKNPDMAELARGKTGRVYGNLMALLTVMKSLPLAYNKDMQEDKEPLFDTLDTVNISLDVFIPMIKSMKVKAGEMEKSARKGFMNATDLADYLTVKGIPFRDAYKISGQLVSYCIGRGCSLEELPIDEYKSFSDIIEEDVYEAVDLKNCVERRKSAGGTSKDSVKKQIEYIEDFLILLPD